MMKFTVLMRPIEFESEPFGFKGRCLYQEFCGPAIPRAGETFSHGGDRFTVDQVQHFGEDGCCEILVILDLVEMKTDDLENFRSLGWDERN